MQRDAGKVARTPGRRCRHRAFVARPSKIIRMPRHRGLTTAFSYPFSRKRLEPFQRILLGLWRAVIEGTMADFQELSELGEYLALPVRTYSAWMTARLRRRHFRLARHLARSVDKVPDACVAAAMQQRCPFAAERTRCRSSNSSTGHWQFA